MNELDDCDDTQEPGKESVEGAETAAATLEKPKEKPKKKPKFNPEKLVAAKFPEKSGLDRKIHFLWEHKEIEKDDKLVNVSFFRVNFWKREIFGCSSIEESHFVVVKGNKIEVGE